MQFNYTNITLFIPVKHEHKIEVNKIQSEFKDAACLMTQQHDKKYNNGEIDWLHIARKLPQKWQSGKLILDKLESKLVSKI